MQTAYRRTWSLPGGLLDKRETPLGGLRREVREEVGLDVDVVGEPIVIVDLGRQLRGLLLPSHAARRNEPG